MLALIRVFILLIRYALHCVNLHNTVSTRAQIKHDLKITAGCFSVFWSIFNIITSCLYLLCYRKDSQNSINQRYWSKAEVTWDKFNSTTANNPEVYQHSVAEIYTTVTSALSSPAIIYVMDINTQVTEDPSKGNVSGINAVQEFMDSNTHICTLSIYSLC